MEQLVDLGAWVFSGQLTNADGATIVSSTRSDHMLTDGAYAEPKEHIAEFYAIDVADLDVALDLARYSRFNTAR